MGNFSKGQQRFLARDNRAAWKAILAAINSIRRGDEKVPSLDVARGDFKEAEAVKKITILNSIGLDKKPNPNFVEFENVIKQWEERTRRAQLRYVLARARYNIAKLLARGMTLAQIEAGMANTGREITGKGLRLKNVKRWWVIRRNR